MTPIVDAHQHFWDPPTRWYQWLENDRDSPLYRVFTPDDLAPHLRAAGVDRTVLVQSTDTYDDTFSMLAIADRHPWVGGVVGWVPLDRHHEAEAALDRLQTHDAFVGVRHLIHDLDDPDWVIRSEVIAGLRLLADRDLTFDLVAVLPRHLEHASTIAAAVPELRLVIDHLAKPPIAVGGWEPWAGLLAEAASHPNVYAKVSGLNTAADHDRWVPSDLQPYVDHAVETFGTERLMFGSDWPVANLAGDYAKVWEATCDLLAGLGATDRAEVLGGTATVVYRL